MHMQKHALATLAVQKRESSRVLLFDDDRRSFAGDERARTRTRNCPPLTDRPTEAFCGIHVISPHLLRMMQEEGAFSIIDCVSAG